MEINNEIHYFVLIKIKVYPGMVTHTYQSQHLQGKAVASEGKTLPKLHSKFEATLIHRILLSQ